MKRGIGDATAVRAREAFVLAATVRRSPCWRTRFCGSREVLARSARAGLRGAVLTIGFLWVAQTAFPQVLSAVKVRIPDEVSSAVLAANSQFGQEIGALGDLDGDGITEIAVGAPWDYNRGSVWILFLRADGSLKTWRKIGPGVDGVPPELSPFGEFGQALTPLGDADGDGTPDLAVSTVRNLGDMWAVWVFFLNPDGSVKGWWRNELTNAYYRDLYPGACMAPIGTLTGSAFPEIAVGYVGVFGGSGYDYAMGDVAALTVSPTGQIQSGTVFVDAPGGLLSPEHYFGMSAASLGDLNGDGRVDLAVGAVALSHSAASTSLPIGKVIIELSAMVPGSYGQVPGYTARAIENPAPPPVPADSNDYYFDLYGGVAAPLGDLEGTGEFTLAVGTTGIPFPDNPTTPALWLYSLGSDGDVNTCRHVPIPDPDPLFHSIPSSLAPLGDMNGDGVMDLAVGALGDDEGGDKRGAIWILFLEGRRPQPPRPPRVALSDSTPTDNLHPTLYSNDPVIAAAIGPARGDATLLEVCEDENWTSPLLRVVNAIPYPMAVGTTSVQLPPGDGPRTLWTRYSGPGGAGESTSATIVLDTRAPEGGRVLPIPEEGNPVDWTLGIPIEFPVDPGDTASGFNSVILFYRTNGGPWTQYSAKCTASPIQFSLLVDGYPVQDGYWEFYIQGIDNAGNIQPKTPAAEAGFLYHDPRYIPQTTSNWQKIGPGAGHFTGPLSSDDFFGTTLAPLGDLDGDGIPDIAVGAPGNPSLYPDEAGAVWILFLNADGSVKSERRLGEEDMASHAAGLDSDARGRMLAALGDLDGDGVPDLAVGGNTDYWVLLLNRDGSVKSSVGAVPGTASSTASPDFICPPDHMAAPGDLDGDGTPDLVITESMSGKGQDFRAHILLLRPDGSLKNYQIVSSHDLIDKDGDGVMRACEGLAFPGDLNGDGYADMVVAIWDSYFIISLDRDGALKSYRHFLPYADGYPPPQTVYYEDGFTGILAPGDLDNDGTGDLVFQAATHKSWGDALWILYLNADGSVRAQSEISHGVGNSPIPLGIRCYGGSYIQSGLSRVGDLNSDGRSEWAVGLPLADFVTSTGVALKDSGAIWIFTPDLAPAPSPTPTATPPPVLNLNPDAIIALDDVGTQPAPGVQILGADVCGRLGSDVAGAGDINGDGIEDITLTAPWAYLSAYAHSTYPYGRISGYLMYGSETFPPVAAETIYRPAESRFPIEFLDANSGLVLLGNTRGDPAAVSGAGDVDGDGIDDLLVSEPEFVGSAWLLHGTRTGMGADGVLRLALTANARSLQVKGSIVYERFGNALSGAGDFNGDGYADWIAAGAWARSPYDGVPGPESVCNAYVFPGGVLPSQSGSASVLAPDLIFARHGAILSNPAQPLSVGRTARGAGDVNGDGLDDLLVTAPLTDQSFGERREAGRVYLLFGNRDGLGAVNGHLDLGTFGGPRGGRFVGAHAFDEAGLDAAGVGDVNGDGYADLVIGAPGADPNDLRGAGEAYLIYGAPDLFGADGVYDLRGVRYRGGVVLQGAEIGGMTGWSVSGAGDVDGDGFADFLVGSPRAVNRAGETAGAACLLFGSPDRFGQIGVFDLADLDGARGLRYEGRGRGARAGASVSAAGDLNADGFGDFLIGADRATTRGLADAGEAYAILGGGTWDRGTWRGFVAPGDAPRRAVGLLGDGSQSVPPSRAWIDFTGGHGPAGPEAASLESVSIIRIFDSLNLWPRTSLGKTYWSWSTDRVDWSEAILRLKYTSAEVRGLNETALILYRADSASGPFQPLDTGRDPCRNLLWATVDTSGVFAVGEPDAYSMTPEDPPDPLSGERSLRFVPAALLNPETSPEENPDMNGDSILDVADIITVLRTLSPSAE